MFNRSRVSVASLRARRRIAFLLLGLLLLSPNVFIGFGILPGRGGELAFILASAASVGFWLLAPSWRWVAWVNAAIFPLMAIWVGYAHFLGAPPHPATLNVLAATSPAEIVSWCQNRPTLVALFFVGWIFSAISAWVVHRVASCKMPSKSGLAILLLGCAVLIAWRDLGDSSSGYFQQEARTALTSVWPIGPVVTAVEVLTSDHERSNVNAVDAALDPTRAVTRAMVTDSRTEDGIVVVFVIGESHRADTLSPAKRPDLAAALRRRMDAGLLVEFTDVISASNLTIFSVPAMVTGTNPESMMEGVRGRPSGLGLFKSAGYFSGWISNQSSDLFREQGWDFASFSPSPWLNVHDTVLLDSLRQVLSLRQNKVSLVLHMMGSHFDYEVRYPPTFRDLPPKGDATRFLRQNYENSVAFSVLILERVLDLLDRDSRPAVLVFSSDHGENLMDDDRRLIWHGGTVPPSVHEFRVATFIAWNEAWRSRFKEHTILVQEVSRRPLTHADLFPLWLTVGGLREPNGAIPWSNDGMKVKPEDRTVYFAGRRSRISDLR